MELSPPGIQVYPPVNNHKTEQALLLMVGVMQGVALVTFPAISGVLTGSDGYGLSSSSYGLIFLPQVIAAIAASFLGAQASRSWGAKCVLLWGLISDAASMVVLLFSSQVMHQPSLGLPLLMLATALMGFGFGGVVPVLNTFIADFEPSRVDQAVLMLNALLGLGTALAPALAALVVGPGIWWLLPLLVLLAALLLWIGCRRQPLQLSRSANQLELSSQQREKSAGLLLLFLAVATLYGLSETLNGNWAVLLMSRQLDSSPQLSSLALTLFWALVTLGRLLFSRFSRFFPPRMLLPGLPVFLAMVFVGISRLAPGDGSAGVLLFALAGLGCSALLPLIISFGQQQLSQLGESTAGVLIAFYQLGYGLASFGGGSLQKTFDLSISSLFGWGACVAVALAMFAALITLWRRPKASFAPGS
jgi:MFS family permease